MHWTAASALGLMVWTLSTSLSAQEQPSGPVLLTVVGEIARTNRGPFEEAYDKFAAYHDVRFDKAYGFDQAMLEALPQAQTTVKLSDWENASDLAGPALSAILETAGARDLPVRIIGFDGFSADYTPDELAAENWLLAMTRDEEPLSLAGLGPLWVVHDPDAADGSLVPGEAQKWPWNVFLIEVGETE